MKITIKIFALVLLCGCVSAAKYRSMSEELEDVLSKKKQINKEIKSAEKLNKKLEDSINKEIEYSLLEINKIEKRLAKFGIIVKLNAEKFDEIGVENQNYSNEYYELLLKKNNFVDTNSAQKTNWLSKKEKELIYWLNYARLNPKKFCMKYVIPRYKDELSDVYVATLIDYMLSMKPMPALMPDKTLYESALCHAESMGKAGKIGHARIDGCKSTYRGECCSYGLDDPLSVVIQLLVDKGVKSLGHRYICLGSYAKLGVSMKPHKTYRTNVVLDFSYL
ncbi:MAG: CAP domain-containing protein [Bacteroidetes bacterium]|nr:CAP domain-containing protein [Bacteroidota bacterium]